MARQRRPDSETKPWWSVGIVRDKAWQGADVAFKGDGFVRYVVEFDDQGYCHYEDQIPSLAKILNDLTGQHPIIIVFVHGWKHNAKPQDQNLEAFDQILAQTARAERAAHQAEKKAETLRPVIGIYVGWRGMSFYAGWLTNLTFWNRKTAALRVALGSIRELFARLRHFRERQDSGSALVIVGHSFGGLIVYSALAQSLIELATFSDHLHVEPSFANLVLLVNPAFEAARYLPVHALVTDRAFARQPPILISVTSTNDDATGKAFPIGARLGSFWEHGRDAEQREAIIRTMGHIKRMRTHKLSLENPNARPAATASDQQLAAERIARDEDYQERRAHWSRHFDGGAVLRHEEQDPNNPFWVVEATPDIIDGHNGIYKDAFLGFVRKLVAEQLRAPADAGNIAPRQAL